MSIDAGGVAQMTYNQNNMGGGLGMPGSGFASRGKGSHLKRLNFTPPSKISTIDENNPAQPRTSRSHLLAGLRTAPRSSTLPMTAPSQMDQHFDNKPRYVGNEPSFTPRGVPQTATGSVFPQTFQDRYQSTRNSMTAGYSQPEHVLAPPTIHIGDEEGNTQLDQSYYDELVRTNQRLAQQQRQLQQQLIDATAAAQLAAAQQATAQQFYHTPLQRQYSLPTQSLGYYNHQMQQTMQQNTQPIVQAVAGQPGVYTVYNPQTGQVDYFVDQKFQQSQAQIQNGFANFDLSHSPPPPTPTFRAEVSPPPESPTQLSGFRNPSPQRATPSPPKENVNPLPPPSATAFKAAHRKGPSGLNLSQTQNSSSPSNSEVATPTGSKFSGVPQTPMTGTFGPGQNRSGEHPIRQPRGPPALEELLAKPTAKHEGSRNFATRQRRRAVHNLVRAGLERRATSRGHGSIDSLESSTPASESEITFSISSEGDSDSVSGSASLLGQSTAGDLFAGLVNTAIGSERKELKERSRERGANDPLFLSPTSELSNPFDRKLNLAKDDSSERRRAPMLVLSSAEKRKSSTF